MLNDLNNKSFCLYKQEFISKNMAILVLQEQTIQPQVPLDVTSKKNVKEEYL